MGFIGGFFGVVAEAAAAVGVVELAGCVAVGFGAVSTGAFGAVGEDFSGCAGLAGRGDFLFVGSEDDSVDAVFEAGVGERAGLEVDGGGAVGVDDGVGLSGLELAFEDGELREMVVGLDGGAVLGKLEGDGDGAVSPGPGGEAALAPVVVTEASVFDGRGLAVCSGGHDVSAERERHLAPQFG